MSSTGAGTDSVRESTVVSRAPLRGLAVLVLLALAVFLAALLIGSSGISAPRALAALAGGGDEATRTVLIGVRLPRVLAGFGVGERVAEQRLQQHSRECQETSDAKAGEHARQPHIEQHGARGVITSAGERRERPRQADA